MTRALVAVVFALSALVTVGGPAEAATKGCVTRSEYRAIEKGMTRAQVERAFDARRSKPGDGGAGGYSRIYRACDQEHGVVVEYAVGAGGVPRFDGFKRWIVMG